MICGTRLNQYVILVNPIDLMLFQSKASHQLAPWTSFMNPLNTNTSEYWLSFKISNKWSSLHNWHLQTYFKHLTEQGLRPAVQWYARKLDSRPSLKHNLPKMKEINREDGNMSCLTGIIWVTLAHQVKRWPQKQIYYNIQSFTDRDGV